MGKPFQLTTYPRVLQKVRLLNYYNPQGAALLGSLLDPYLVVDVTNNKF